MAKTAAAVSLDDLDITKKCDDVFEFEYIDPNGNNTGIFISVIGKHSKKVQQFANDEINKARKQRALDAKRGKTEDFSPVEDDIDFIIRDAANRIVGWRGIDNPCSPENTEFLCRINPEIRRQVVEASNELANFTKSK